MDQAARNKVIYVCTVCLAGAIAVLCVPLFFECFRKSTIQGIHP